MSKKPVIKCSDFNQKLLKISEVQDRDKQSTQMVSFVNYHYPDLGVNSSLCVKFPKCRLIWGGIIPLNEKTKKFFDTESKRAFISLAIDDETQESCKEIEKMITDYEKEVLEQAEIFLKPKGGLKSYSYSSLIRRPEEEDDEEEEQSDGDKKDDKKKYKKHATVRVKFDYDFENSAIRTKVYLMDPKTQKRTLLKVNNLSSLEKYVRLGCQLKIIARFSKIWITRSKLGGDKKRFGTTLKMDLLEITPSETATLREELNEDVLDSDTSESVRLKLEQKIADPVKTDSPAKKIRDKDKDKEKEESHSESEKKPSKPAPKPKGKSVKGKGKKKESDSDTEDVITTPQKKKKPASSDSD